jgi:hypothetical protein
MLSAIKPIRQSRNGQLPGVGGSDFNAIVTEYFDTIDSGSLGVAVVTSKNLLSALSFLTFVTLWLNLFFPEV